MVMLMRFSNKNFNVLEKEIGKECGKNREKIVINDLSKIIKNQKIDKFETEIIIKNLTRVMKCNLREVNKIYEENYKHFYKIDSKKYEGKWIAIKNKKVILNSSTQSLLIKKIKDRDKNDLQEMFISCIQKKI